MFHFLSLYRADNCARTQRDRTRSVRPRWHHGRISIGTGKLDLGPGAHCADRSNPRYWGCDDAPRNGEDSGQAGEPEPWFAVSDPDRVVGVVSAAGLLLAALHGIESTIWAATYLWLGAADSPLDALLYSFDSMTTRGASGLVLQLRWRITGALEAAGGMLLFGISTAYIFAIMQVYWPMLSRRH
jgi:hypothetical protein